MRLLHCADIHLGKEPFQLEERFEDFGRVFRHLADRAVEEKVDAFLIGGDLFDKRNINAATLALARRGLARLREAGIPVVAIEGNHDKAFHHDRTSWMEYLADEELLILLKPEFDEGEPILNAWDPETRRGAWIDLGDVRIFGFGYRGALVDRFLEAAAPLLPERPDRFTVLLLHAGVGTGDTSGGFGAASEEALAAFRGKAHLLLLGHWHRMRDHTVGDDPPLRAIMPGSPEICHLHEAGTGHGFFLIDVPSHPEGEIEAIFEPTPHRPHLRERIAVDGCVSSEDVIARVAERCGELNANEDVLPIVEVTLEGELPFSPLDLPVEAIRAAVQDALPCLHVEIVNDVNLPKAMRERLSLLGGREAVERAALRELIAVNELYGPHADRLVDLAIAWRDRALDANAQENRDEELVDLLIHAVEELGLAERPDSSATKDTDSEPPSPAEPLTLPGFE